MGTSRRKAGPLCAEVEGYRAWLTQHGYTPQTVRNMLQYLGQLGRWLGTRGLEVYDLDEQRMAAFLADRQTAGKPRVLGPRAIRFGCTLERPSCTRRSPRRCSPTGRRGTRRWSSP